jgi:catechol 2,3-dioxygenase-like lactoylglutathione lyase family enzyme
MEIQFVASIAVITADQAASRALYVDGLGLPLGHADGDDYLHTDRIEGTRHFGVWPLTQAAMACFGTPEWPAEHPVPQVSVEFELADDAALADAAGELTGRGWRLLHGPRTEPWGQTVARLLSPEGAIIGLSYIPSMH